MQHYTIRSVGLGLLALALLAVSAPAAVDAQFRVGGHAAHAGNAFGGSSGLGVRAGFDLPFAPLGVTASAEYFFPDCASEADGCGLRGYGVDANFRMVLPVVRPYVSGGLVYRRLAPGGGLDARTHSGLAAGAGVDVSLSAVRAFGEGRYEFVSPVRQAVWRVGLLMSVP